MIGRNSVQERQGITIKTQGKPQSKRREISNQSLKFDRTGALALDTLVKAYV